MTKWKACAIGAILHSVIRTFGHSDIDSSFGFRELRTAMPYNVSNQKPQLLEVRYASPPARPHRSPASRPELRRVVARGGVPADRPERGVQGRPRRARPRDELHRHLAVLRARHVGGDARPGAEGHPARP